MDLKDDEALLPPGLAPSLGEDGEDSWLRLLRAADYRTRRLPNGHVALSRAPTKRAIFIENLKDKHGEFVGDVDRLVTGPLHQGGAAATRKHLRDVLANLGMDNFSTNLTAAAVKFWVEPDPLAVAKWLDSQYGGPHFYRLRPRAEWGQAEILWRILLVAMDEDRTFREVIENGYLPPRDAATPFMSLHPSLLVTIPLVARTQPLAAVFITSTASEIVALPSGGAWTRLQYLDAFPVSMGGRVDLLGASSDAYKSSFDTIPSDWGEPLLAAMAKGASEAVAVLNDPAMWRDANGYISPVERYITEATLRVGLDAVNAIGASWGGGENVWMAFRSLGALAGLWEGNTGRSLLKHLLNPDVAGRSATPANVPETYRKWCAEVLAAYASELSKLFPGEDSASATESLVEIRNLVHGVGAIPNKKRDRRSRFDVMRRIGQGALVHLRDLSTMWWTSVIQSPRAYLRPGQPPSTRRRGISDA